MNRSGDQLFSCKQCNMLKTRTPSKFGLQGLGHTLCRSLGSDGLIVALAESAEISDHQVKGLMQSLTVLKSAGTYLTDKMMACQPRLSYIYIVTSGCCISPFSSVDFNKYSFQTSKTFLQKSVLFHNKICTNVHNLHSSAFMAAMQSNERYTYDLKNIKCVGTEIQRQIWGQ